MSDFKSISINDLNKSQQQRVRRFLRGVTDDRLRSEIKYGIGFEVSLKRCGSTVSLTVQPDLHSLGEGNLLRFLASQDRWHVFVGKRGGLQAVTYPKSFKQFKGRNCYLGPFIK